MFDDDYTPKTKSDKFFDNILPWFFLAGILILIIAAVYLAVHLAVAVYASGALDHAK
jgi:hypothetical protein